MIDNYAGCIALGTRAGVERLGCRALARREFVVAQEVQTNGKTGRADIGQHLINKQHAASRGEGVGFDQLSFRRNVVPQDQVKTRLVLFSFIVFGLDDRILPNSAVR